MQADIKFEKEEMDIIVVQSVKMFFEQYTLKCIQICFIFGFVMILEGFGSINY